MLPTAPLNHLLASHKIEWISEMIIKSKAIIAGGFVLSAYSDFKSSDVDIFIDNGFELLVDMTLTRNGWKEFIGNPKSTSSSTSGSTSLTDDYLNFSSSHHYYNDFIRVLYIKPESISIDVIICFSPPLKMIQDTFDISVCQTYFDGICVKTLDYEGVINKTFYVKQKTNNTLLRIKKYKSRNYKCLNESQVKKQVQHWSQIDTSKIIIGDEKKCACGSIGIEFYRIYTLCEKYIESIEFNMPKLSCNIFSNHNPITGKEVDPILIILYGVDAYPEFIKKLKNIEDHVTKTHTNDFILRPIINHPKFRGKIQYNSPLIYIKITNKTKIYLHNRPIDLQTLLKYNIDGRDCKETLEFFNVESSRLIIASVMRKPSKIFIELRIDDIHLTWKNCPKNILPKESLYLHPETCDVCNLQMISRHYAATKIQRSWIKKMYHPDSQYVKKILNELTLKCCQHV
jgi:hypothetical protein